ncbi:MAG: phosphatidate cytidylyltransferase [Sideroxydans sp.]
MLKQRIVTALMLGLAFLLALFAAPRWLWQALVLAMVWQAASEWGRLSGLSVRGAQAYRWGLPVLLGGILAADDALGANGATWLHLVFYGSAILLWVFVVPAWLIGNWQPKWPRFLAVTGVLVIVPTALALLDLRAADPWILLFCMAMVWIADSAAYFSGRRFGKTKLAPAISPGKTWEGVYGALAAVTLFILLCWLAGAFHPYPMFFPGILIAGCWWVGLAIIGDLFESAIKRLAGVKDSGTLLPGHGGLLDRIDALTSTLPFAAVALMLQRLS